MQIEEFGIISSTPFIMSMYLKDATKAKEWGIEDTEDKERKENTKRSNRVRWEGGADDGNPKELVYPKSVLCFKILIHDK